MTDKWIVRVCLVLILLFVVIGTVLLHYGGRRYYFSVECRLPPDADERFARGESIQYNCN